MQPAIKPASRTRQVAAAVIGNALEWYDFVVYGFVAKLFAETIFPSDDPNTALLTALATFGVGFCTRPIGGILLGVYADRKGRKAALQLIIIVMTVAIALITFAPPYAVIGIGAPIIIVVARLLQGFAAGGEFSSATAFLVESAPPHRRGLYGAWQMIGQCSALLFGNCMGALVTGLLDPEAVSSWGWRIPFGIGLLIAPVGFWIRRHMEETQAFVDASREQAPVSLRQIMRAHRRAVLVTLGLTIIGSTTFYGSLISMPNLASSTLGLPMDKVFMVQIISVIVMIAMIPLTAWWSDLYGRKRILMIGTLGTGLAAYPLYAWMAAEPSIASLMAAQLLLCTLIGISYGPLCTAVAEQFETRMRSSGIAVAYNLAVLVFGGFAPFIVTWLVQKTGNPAAPAWYVMLGSAIGVTAIVFMRDGVRSRP